MDFEDEDSVFDIVISTAECCGECAWGAFFCVVLYVKALRNIHRIYMRQGAAARYSKKRSEFELYGT